MDQGVRDPDDGDRVVLSRKVVAGRPGRGGKKGADDNPATTHIPREQADRRVLQGPDPEFGAAEIVDPADQGDHCDGHNPGCPPGQLAQALADSQGPQRHAAC